MVTLNPVLSLCRFAPSVKPSKRTRAKKNGFFEIADRINRECGEQGGDMNTFFQTTQQYLAALNQRPEISIDRKSVV